MGRAKDLERDRDVFLAVLDDGEQTWLGFAALPVAQQKTLAEDVLLRFMVGWEYFLSEWYIGAITLDARKFSSALQGRLVRWQQEAVRQSDVARYEEFFLTPKVAIKRRPRLDDVRDLVDPSGRNVGFRDFTDFEQRARRDLAREFNDRVAAVRRVGGDEVVDAASAIRNVLAHRSDRSVREMNARVGAMPTFPDLRKPTMSRGGIGAYLRARRPSGDARLTLYARELARIARVLAP
jgi:hypothetical protein